jgi:DNA-binding PadR family transcriptional regulator
MSIRHGLLALLAEAPAHGYALRAELEERTGGTWRLNVGQVYTTLARLRRDELVEPADGSSDQVVYSITAAGRQEVRRWFDEPVSRDAPDRDELAIKLALAVRQPGVDVVDLIQRQRVHGLRVLQDLTILKRRADADPDDLSWSLVVDGLIFRAEAEIRWLDHCEARVARASREHGGRPGDRRPAAETAPTKAPAAGSSPAEAVATEAGRS